MKAAATEDEIETLISSLPLIRYLRSSALTAESASTSASVPLYREFRLHSNMPPKSLSAHMVGGSLFAPDKLPVYPRLFIQTQPTCSIIAVFYIGRHLCGHPGYVHGGVLFSLFDDIFARCSALILPNGIGMTANMNINFRKPSLPDRVYILRAEVASHEGRKSFVNGSIRSLAPFTADDLMQLEATSDGDLSIQEQEADLVAEASSLFIEPKFADVSLLLSYIQLSLIVLCWVTC